MNTQKYKLSFIPLFEEDLNEITDYIANHLQNPDAALRLFFLSIYLCVSYESFHDRNDRGL